MDGPGEPLDLRTMGEVRAAVDAVDRQLVALIARRFDCIDAAARIKPTREAVRDEERKAEVLAKVTAESAAAGLDPSLMVGLWEVLVEASIAHELAEFDRLRGGAVSSD